ncbi:hypothetical protein [Nocardioides sp. AX2bis]|uniref:hypothetical protein n=1 Tax=Nocardioides sp. AX2bis TaxID=2653157 RepID=UPI001357F52B|nr:hypothetical protein [Nocardioides sp. AX2bis]
MLVVGGVAWAALVPDRYVAGSSVPPGAERGAPVVADGAAAARAVEQVERAVQRRDTGPVAGLGADPAAQERLDAVVANARALDVADVDLRYVEETSPVDADGRWRAGVEVTWRFAGYDRDVASTETSVDLVTDEDGTRVVALAPVDGSGPGAGRSPVWLTGPVEVASSPTTLVVQAADTSDGPDAEAYDARAARAVAVVERVLAGWDGRLVIEVPAGETGLDAALGVEPGTYGAIAAVTAAVDGAPAGSPVHVFLNPDVYGQLQAQGAQVVMSHEAVHVATRAPSSGALPLWLLEGFADYVALRDVDLPLSTTAAQVVEQVREDGLPRALPGQAEFATGATHLGATYEAAWVACLVLAERGGEEALVDLYDAVDRGESVTKALRADFGWDEADLTDAWRDRLDSLAG